MDRPCTAPNSSLRRSTRCKAAMASHRPRPVAPSLFLPQLRPIQDTPRRDRERQGTLATCHLEVTRLRATMDVALILLLLDPAILALIPGTCSSASLEILESSK